MRVLHNGQDVTSYVSSLNIASSIDNLSTSISFTVPYHKNTEFFRDIKVGDKIEFNDFFIGLVVDTQISDNNLSVKCFDIAFYLNRNKIIKQIRQTSGNEAIKNICSELDVSVEIKGLNTKINKMYKNTSVSDLIKDIIKQDNLQTSTNYIIYALADKVYIEPIGTQKVELSFKLSSVDTLRDKQLIQSETISENIEELVNAVVVTSNDSKSVKQYADSSNNESIIKFGRIQEIVELDSKKVNTARQVASDYIKEKSSIKKTYTINIISDVYCFAGQEMTISSKKYHIKSTNLNVENGYYTGSIELKEI